MIKNYHKNLPIKAKREFFPHVIWILPPEHISFANNDQRNAFSEAMESVISELPAMCCLHLKKVWDPEENAFYRWQQRRYTLEGYHAYWLAVDASVKFWVKTLSDILVKKQKKKLYVVTNMPNDGICVQNNANSKTQSNSQASAKKRNHSWNNTKYFKKFHFKQDRRHMATSTNRR